MNITFHHLFKAIASFSFVILLAACDAQSGSLQPGEHEQLNAESTSLPLLTIYKSPTCGCCEEWVEHVNHHGFDSKIIHPADLNSRKDELGISANLRSCHTAVTDNGFVFEGHVPAKYIAKFLANPPLNAIGLSVPGMVVGSPGMEVDDKFRAYQVLLLNRDGSTSVYAAVSSYQQQF